MIKKLYYLVISLSLFILAACTGNDPGPLAGTWRLGGVMPMTVQFRPGETESLGMIEHVSYEVKGNDVLVTYQDGMAKGMAIRYTMTSQNTAETALGSLQRLN